MISKQTRNKLTTIAENQQKVYNNGVADGKRAEYDAFWDNITAGGTRTNYERCCAFWSSEYIKPTRKIVPTANRGHYYFFADCKDLLKVEKEYFDFSQVGGLNQTSYGNLRTFSGCVKLVEVEDVGLPAAYYDGTFYDCLELVKIEVIRSNEDTVFDDNFVAYCRKLRELEIEGIIGKNFNIRHCPLSPASLKSIVKHLKNYVNTSSEFAYTLTVKASAWQALESEGFTDEDYRHILSVFPDTNPTLVDSWNTFVVAWLRWNLVLAS